VLSNDYTYFLSRILGAALQSPTGVACVALLLAAGILLARSAAGRWQLPAAGAALAGAFACFVMAFLNAVYTYDEQPEAVNIPTLPTGAPTCGTATSGWIRSGYGMGNPCPAGCYRGKVLLKQMRMRGLPPWPEHRRKLQCWKRD